MTTATTTQTGILRTILEDPHNNLPRLVYADWCEENGDIDRASFIRAQIANQLVKAFVANARRWFGPILPDGRYEIRPGRGTWRLWFHGSPTHNTALVRRGFLCRVTLPLATFLRHAAELFAAHPITHVVLSDRRPQRSQGRYWWQGVAYDDQSNDAPHMLPSCLSALLPPMGESRFFLESEKDAYIQLSRACVAYGRLNAEPYLPSLP